MFRRVQYLRYNFNEMVQLMMKMISAAGATVLILVGLIVLPMPIPLGAIMIVIGLIWLISASSTVARCVQSYRRKHPKTDKFIRVVEPKLPASLQAILKRTDP